MRRAAEIPVQLPVALSNFPLQVGAWIGTDVPVPEAIQRVARNDDFLHRQYINQDTRQWISLYIAFSARPRSMRGHRPQDCYPASGWQREKTEHIQVMRRSGLPAACLLHQFFMPEPYYRKSVVLNYYILNGLITGEEGGFSGLDYRSPNIEGSLAKYVAQVQISSELENTVLDAAEQFTDLILDYFPDAEGEVKAASDQSSI